MSLLLAEVLCVYRLPIAAYPGLSGLILQRLLSKTCMARVKRRTNDPTAIWDRQLYEQARSAARSYRPHRSLDDEGSCYSFSSSYSSWSQSSSWSVVVVDSSVTHRNLEEDIECRCLPAYKVASEKIRNSQRTKCKRLTYNCLLCRKNFHSPSPQPFHFSSSLHLANSAQEADNKPPHCKQCNTTFVQLIDLGTHLLSSKHRRKGNYLKKIQN